MLGTPPRTGSRYQGRRQRCRLETSALTKAALRHLSGHRHPRHGARLGRPTAAVDMTPAAMATSCFWLSACSKSVPDSSVSRAPGLIHKACHPKFLVPPPFLAGNEHRQKPLGSCVACSWRHAPLPRQPLWDNGLTQAGPRFAYARHAAPPPNWHGNQNSACTACAHKGNRIMPAGHSSAISHCNASHAAVRNSRIVLARSRRSAGLTQRAIRSAHAAAERRRQTRNTRGARIAAGCWPFHACAICAPPGCRSTRR